MEVRSNIRSIAWRRAVSRGDVPSVSPTDTHIVEELDDLRHQVSFLQKAVRILITEVRKLQELELGEAPRTPGAPAKQDDPAP